MERKKQKKLRQKEQKTKEQSNGEKVALTIAANSLELSFLAEMHSPIPPQESNSGAAYILADVTSFVEPVLLSNNEENNDIEAQFDLSSDHLDSGFVQNVGPTMVSVNGPRRWQMPKSLRAGRNGFHGNQNHILKLESLQKHTSAKDRATVASSSKVWTKKFKVDNDEESLRPRLEESVNQSEENKCELMIGSISVPVRNCISRKKKISLGEAQYRFSTEQGKIKKCNVLDEPANADSHQSGVNRCPTKLWRPVSRGGTRGPSPVQRANHDSKEGVILEKLEDRIVSDGNCLQSSASNDDHSKIRENLTSLYEGTALPQGLQFSSAVAKSFLAESMFIL